MTPPSFSVGMCRDSRYGLTLATALQLGHLTDCWHWMQDGGTGKLRGGWLAGCERLVGHLASAVGAEVSSLVPVCVRFCWDRCGGLSRRGGSFALRVAAVRGLGCFMGWRVSVL